MDGVEFLAALAEIVGADNAAKYAAKFGDLDDIFMNEITNKEALAFFAYTTGLEWYQVINSQLWSGTASVAVKKFSEVLNSGLSHLPRYAANEGIVYRGFQTPDIAAFRAKYHPGAVVTFPGFTSATFHAPSAFGGNVFFTIRSLNARVIWYVAADYLEHEVLFPTNCRFRVSESFIREDRIAVELQELP